MPVIRCPTEQLRKRQKTLDSQDNHVCSDSFGKEQEYESIDLDKELLDTKSSHWREDILKVHKVLQSEDQYLSPSKDKKGSPISRLITENTDNTKADSLVKHSANSNKLGRSKLSSYGFDLDSFPSGNIFRTKSKSDLDEEENSIPEMVKADEVDSNIVPETQTDKIESVETSIQCSEHDNSELKQTADFFRPPNKQVSEASSKRSSFGFKKKTPSKHTSLTL